jgi:hypothetical protein
MSCFSELEPLPSYRLAHARLAAPGGLGLFAERAEVLEVCRAWAAREVARPDQG